MLGTERVKVTTMMVTPLIKAGHQRGTWDTAGEGSSEDTWSHLVGDTEMTSVREVLFK